MSDAINKFDKLITWIKRDKDGKWIVSFGLKDYVVIWATLGGATTFKLLVDSIVILKHVFS